MPVRAGVFVCERELWTEREREREESEEERARCLKKKESVCAQPCPCILVWHAFRLKQRKKELKQP